MADRDIGGTAKIGCNRGMADMASTGVTFFRNMRAHPGGFADPDGAGKRSQLVSEDISRPLIH